MLGPPRKRRPALRVVVLCGLLAALVVGAPRQVAANPVQVIVSSVTSSAGSLFTVTNHLVGGSAPTGRSREFLVVWAGDGNISDITGAQLANAPLALNPAGVPAELRHTLPGPDFLAVIDADKDSATYGKVVNTAVIGPLVENEPHHMQYIYHKGDKIFAGGLYSSITYVFDVSQLPVVRLSGITLPTDTLCGSVPDAYWVLSDHTAYGTYMGGPVLPGPCLYSNLATRLGNGYAGSPGEVVRISPQGTVLSQTPASRATAENPARCVNIPTVLVSSCANPHGIQVREDLNRMVTSDYAEPRNIILDPVRPLSPYVARNTVRVWDISNRNSPVLSSVSHLPDGPRTEVNPAHEEDNAVMETTVTNLPGHKGAFAETMCGGAIYYTPDVTVANPVWREVFDNTTAARRLDPAADGGCDGGGWVQTSLDDKYLYHAVIGRGPYSNSPTDPGSPKYVYTLDIQQLLASGTNPQCNIDHITEVYNGGAEADCPTVASVLPVPDASTGGPHWGTLDNFKRSPDGFFRETADVDRIAVSNYFVARTGIDGNHKVCLVDVADNGGLTVDPTFIDENSGTPCVDFNRAQWPHGDWGYAKPHSQLFVVADEHLR